MEAFDLFVKSDVKSSVHLSVCFGRGTGLIHAGTATVVDVGSMSHAWL